MSDQSIVDEHGVTHKLSPLRFGNKTAEPFPTGVDLRPILTVGPADDAPLPALSGIARLEERIDALEALVKRIATHFGVEG